MSRADIRSGGGYVELSTRDAKFYAGLKRSLGAASKWAGSIGKLSAVGAAESRAGFRRLLRPSVDFQSSGLRKASPMPGAPSMI